MVDSVTLDSMRMERDALGVERDSALTRFALAEEVTNRRGDALLKAIIDREDTAGLGESYREACEEQERRVKEFVTADRAYIIADRNVLRLEAENG